MSQQPSTTDSSVSRQEILVVANLARLGVDADTADSYASDISKILALMQTLAGVDTTGLTPLANIHEACQELRGFSPQAITKLNAKVLVINIPVSLC